MKCDVKFKSIDYSEGLVEYIKERLQKLAKFEIRPGTYHVTLSEDGHNCRAEFYVKGYNGQFRASESADNYYAAVDACLKKVKRQMEKEKSKIKHHHFSAA